MQNPMPDRNFLWQIFQKVDSDRSGAINATELQQALSNGTWTPFNPETVRMMIGMFDRDGNSTIDFNEFASLWKYVIDWQNAFRTFDRDNSGAIDRNEFKQALTTFGYRFSDKFYDMLLKQSAQRHLQAGHKGPAPPSQAVLFDDFIYLCCRIQTLTNAFRQYDYKQIGEITIKYEDFLTLVFSLKN